jgi:integrase
VRPRKTNAHLPKCVYRRHGGYYLVKKGKWTLLGHDLASALAKYAHHFEEPQGGMGPFIDAALEAVFRKPLAENTRDQYRIAAKKLKHMLAEFTPQLVTIKDVKRMLRNMSDTPNMGNRCLSLLRQIYDYGLDEDLVDHNPTIGVHRLNEPQRGRLLSPQEFEAIYDKADERLQCMMDLWRGTGQRVMDVVRINLRDLTEEGITFKQQKTGAKLLVKWTPELKAVVTRAKALNGNVRSLTLFTPKRGKNRGCAPSYGAVRDAWDAACLAANIEDARLQDLRAMSASQAKREGKDATALLGHTTEAMTLRYLRDKEVPQVEGPSIGRVKKY